MDYPQESDQLNTASKDQLVFDRLQQMAHFQAGFLGTASHELRAPINRIISLHQLILEDLCEGPEEEREFLQQANEAIFEVLKNLDFLIQVSKLDIGAVKPKQEPVLVDGILAKVQQLMEKKCLNRQCRLTIASPSETLIAESDDHWLQQLLLLLLDGALVARSEVLNVSAKPLEASTVEIKMTSDISLDLWKKQAAGEPSASTELDGVEISPGFRYQLAERMAKHLNCSLNCQASQAGGSEIVIRLPEASF